MSMSVLVMKRCIDSQHILMSFADIGKSCGSVQAERRAGVMGGMATTLGTVPAVGMAQGADAAGGRPCTICM